MLRFRTNALPEPAERFLREYSASHAVTSTALHRAAISHFYRFLAQSKHFELKTLERIHLEEFNEDLIRHNLALLTRTAHLRMIHTFLRWLANEELIPGNVSERLFPDWRGENIRPQQAPLPELAERFIAVLTTTHRKNTVNGYKSSLRGFYSLHWKTKKPAYQIDRSDVEAYMLYLKPRHRASKQCGIRLIQLRRYFDWLYDHKKLKTHPDRLISSRDFPKPEQGLPKPLPVDVDIEIQRRLDDSNDIDRLGILLMRRCGLRVGELCMLTLDCLGSDLNGNQFLKVPMGKLKNERIIPLDSKTVEVIERIKRFHAHHPKEKLGSVHLISHPTGRMRKPYHFRVVFDDVTRGLAIPGRANLHRLRHSYATSLLSAGLSITTLKSLLGHHDIKMTLNYAAVTQETVRNEYFTALKKVQTRYEATQYPLKIPDLKDGINRAFKEIPRLAKKYIDTHGNPDPKKLERLLFRANSLRHEFSVLLKGKTS